MKRMLLVGLTVIMAGALMLGCAASPATYTNPASPIEVSNGGQFTIALKGNATTGYTWSADYDKAMFELVSDKYAVDSHPEGMVGVGGTQSLTFKALKAGTGKITCKYARSWETAAPAQASVFNVTVK